MSKQDDAKGCRIFVYGTLKRLHYNHSLVESSDIKGTKFLGACYIEGPYRMLDLNWFPGVQQVVDPSVKAKIYGEVYKIDGDTLKALDIMEGNGHFFTRFKVETPWKKAWMYMIPPGYDGRPVVEEGVWRPNSQEKLFVASGKPSIEADQYFQQQLVL